MSESDVGVAAHVLTNVVIVLERVLRYMNARQLNSCARVCRTWREQVKREKESRDQMRWTYLTPDSDHAESCWDNVDAFIKDSPFEPSLVLVFCTSTLWSLTVDTRGQRKRRKRKAKLSSSEVVIPGLPSKCGFQAVVTGGIIGTDENMRTQEIDMDMEALSVLLLGQFPGVDFLYFSTSHVECAELAKFWCHQCNCKPTCLKPLHHMDVKMLNLYCPLSGIDQEVSYSLFKMFDWPLIAGGFVNEKCLRDSQGQFHSTETSCIVSGLAICGAEVKVASVLIKSDVETDVEVDEAMKQLKDFNIPLTNAFGLMYACVGRGYHIYGKENVESSVFRKHFPDTPLFGFFGNGEIGCVYPPSDPSFNKEKNSTPTHTPANGSVQHESHDGELTDGSGELTDGSGGQLSEAQLKRQRCATKKMDLMHKIKHPPKLLHAYTTVMCLVSLP